MKTAVKEQITALKSYYKSNGTIDGFDETQGESLGQKTKVETPINVGNYVASSIQELPEVKSSDDYEIPDVFALLGIKPTYDAARQYANCWDNCYSTSASRINQAYEELYGVTPIDYTTKYRRDIYLN